MLKDWQNFFAVSGQEGNVLDARIKHYNVEFKQPTLCSQEDSDNPDLLYWLQNWELSRSSHVIWELVHTIKIVSIIQKILRTYVTHPFIKEKQLFVPCTLQGARNTTVSRTQVALPLLTYSLDEEMTISWIIIKWYTVITELSIIEEGFMVEKSS